MDLVVTPARVYAVQSEAQRGHGDCAFGLRRPHLGIVFAVVVFSFALVGTSIWGQKVAAFETLSGSAEWLVLVLFTADIESAPRGEDTYDLMHEHEPIWSPVFVFFYFGLSWLVLLNVVLGILATGYATASQTPIDRSWDLKKLKDEVVDCCICKTRVGHKRPTVLEHLWPFRSSYFLQRIAVARALHAEEEFQRQEFERNEDERLGGNERLWWKRKSFDEMKLRLTKIEAVKFRRQHHRTWPLSLRETLRCFDECVLWWRGNYSDIASKGASEAEELRRSIFSVVRNMDSLQGEVKKQIEMLSKKAEDTNASMHRELHATADVIHGTRAIAILNHNVLATMHDGAHSSVRLQ